MHRNLTVPLRIRMDPETSAKLESLALNSRLSESELVRAALSQKLDEWKATGRVVMPTHATA